MIQLAISVPGQFYSDAITKALEQTGNFRVRQMEEDLTPELPEVALLGVSVHQGYTLKERKSQIQRIRERAPNCRIVLFLDELVSPEQTEGVKSLKQARLIDGFLYASGTMEYLVATLESI
ncbi:MAG: hypothetical protein IK081_03430 [Lachnospiraceae bacterium]|nr:hypothetical protein [Lachnospiraceae bacterium]